MASKKLPENVDFEYIVIKDLETGNIITRGNPSDFTVENIRDNVKGGYEEVVDFKVRPKGSLHPWFRARGL